MKTSNSNGNLPAEETIEALRAYAALCFLVSRFFLETPSPELVRELRRLGCLVPESENSRDTVKESDEEIAHQLAEECTRLFMAAPPYGSIYRVDDKYAGELHGSTSVAVQKYLEHFGFKLSHPGQIPDHLGVLLRFVGETLRAEVDAATVGKTTEIRQIRILRKDFIINFMKPWVKEYMNRVQSLQPSRILTELFTITGDLLELALPANAGEQVQDRDHG